MTCADLRLDEYLDGELDAAARAEAEAHLGACAACRAGLERSRSLDRLLRRAAPAGAAPDAERFLASIRSRTRAPRAVWIRSAAAAAVLLAALGAAWLVRTPAAGVQELIARYAESPDAAIERDLAAAGPPALAALERAMMWPETPERHRFAAAALLFRLADGATRDRVLAAYSRRQEAAPSAGWSLAEPGAEDEDVELVPAAIALALEGQRERAMATLHKLHALNRQAQKRILESVVTLLHSPRPPVQKLALEIVKELDLEFPLDALVDLIDSPELGAEALKFLRKQTGKDFGSDPAAWRRALGQ